MFIFPLFRETVICHLFTRIWPRLYHIVRKARHTWGRSVVQMFDGSSKFFKRWWGDEEKLEFRSSIIAMWVIHHGVVYNSTSPKWSLSMGYSILKCVQGSQGCFPGLISMEGRGSRCGSCIPLSKVLRDHGMYGLRINSYVAIRRFDDFEIQ